MAHYEKYKDSGVEWIGEIPEGWEVQKLKYIADANPSNIDKKSKDNEDNVLLCNYVDVYKNEFISSELNFMKATASSDQITKFILEKGDVIITKDSETPDDIAAPALVAESFDNVVCGYHLTHIKPKNINGDFLFRYFQSKYLNSYFEVSANGVTRYGLSVAKINSALILNPPRPDQTIIANYLDRKTAEIDELIAQKERLLELYEEKKTAIINQAVTKGIDPDVKLKDSGIEWLGEIPDGWKIKRLRYLGSCQNGVSKGGEYFGSGFPFISYGDVYNSFILPQQVNGLAESTEDDRVNYSVRKGDILFTRTSETADEIGLTSTCLNTVKDAIFSGFLIRFRPNKNNLFEGFSKYYFSSKLHRLFFVKEMNLVTRASLSQELLKKLPVVLPSIEEQKQIALYLDESMEHINAKIAKTQKIIELQKEYRTALISEVVTGKIKVTQEAAS
ncbi:restriction endonuclease subunit S [Desulfobacterota bacterium M19]